VLRTQVRLGADMEWLKATNQIVCHVQLPVPCHHQANGMPEDDDSARSHTQQNTCIENPTGNLGPHIAWLRHVGFVAKDDLPAE
jgi:hypothetical protein